MGSGALLGFKVLDRGFMGRYPCLFTPENTEQPVR